MLNKIKYYLIGRHAKRVPLSYPDYQPFFAPFFQRVESAAEADILLAGFAIDIRDNAAEVLGWQAENPALKIVVLSEEPLWDTVFYEDCTKLLQVQQVRVAGAQRFLTYYFLNYFTTDIFNFATVPYFVTTENHYFLRYRQLLTTQLKRGASDLLTHWQQAANRLVFMAEKRLEPKYHKLDKTGKPFGLSVLRTQLAEQARHLMPGTTLAGRGWYSDLMRQDLPDWHLDKLATYSDNTYILSALENTVQPNYISEKLFDAYACGAVPLYFAPAEHRVNEFLPNKSFINLSSSLDEPKQAIEAISQFRPDIQFAKAYRADLELLAARFNNVNLLYHERRLVAQKIFRALLHVVGLSSTLRL